MVHHHGIGVFQDWDERRRWQDPDSILADADLAPGQTFVDIGCGDGFFSIPAARIVGESGGVLAQDINPEAIGRLEKRAAEAGLSNIRASVAEAESDPPCAQCADVVFFGIVLHDFRDPAAVLANARRAIKPGGLLVNVDWKKEPMEMGPPVDIRFDEREATSMIEEAGFSVQLVKPEGQFHYVIHAIPL